ncbi:hypothetical protein BC941DRAFT_480179 [Chlamydoabsidia padenii]|nr:hypothetical protein BC941DRAFT_480179 [Chlamydoabsidia padenii]
MYSATTSRFDQTGYYDPQGLIQQQQHTHPNSPDSIYSTSSPPTPPSSSTSTTTSSSSSTTNNCIPYTTNHIIISQAIDNTTNSSSPIINPLVPSTFSNATTARVKETIARANSIPMEFYHTEFLEYSKETYERKMDAKRNKRKRPSQSPSSATQDKAESSHSSQDHSTKQVKRVCNAELRRQIHIQSEQKRRAQIKDGFDELRKHLPGCNNKKMSKAALLTRTVQHLQHLKSIQTDLLSEVERLVQENDNLKKFQHGVLQRQAMEKMCTF